jgi:flagellar biosynthesis/type III secretory pathway chaperone
MTTGQPDPEALATALERLNAASRELETALLRSDFEAIERATRAMEVAASTLEPWLHGHGPLDVSSAAADTQGMQEAYRRVEGLVRELRERQERNAFLVLAALKLRQQWRNLLAAMTPATYGPTGEPEMKPGRRVISRRA